MQEVVDPAKRVMAGGTTVAFIASGPADFYFYLTRLDHLVLVPSFLLLLAALKRWNRQP